MARTLEAWLLVVCLTARRGLSWCPAAVLAALAGCAGSGERAGFPALDADHFTSPVERDEVAQPRAAARPPAPAVTLARPAPADPSATEQPIDLAGALRLAGASSLDIEFARERLQEAEARMDEARVLWLPDVFLGASYDRHEGNVQTSPGIIIDADQNVGFAGGGLVASFGLADAIFEPGVASREMRAEEAALTSSINDTLLGVALAYTDLLEAQYDLAIAREAVTDVEELAGLAESFARSGQGLEADAARVRSDVARRRRRAVGAEESVATRSARLATRLRLDPTIQLRAAESGLVPLELVPEETPLDTLVQQALGARPEIAQLSAMVDAADRREDQERLRPLIPNLLVGIEGGGLGGGRGSDFDNFDSTADVSIGVVWGLDNLGFGNSASVRRRRSQRKQVQVGLARVRDRVAEEVTVARLEVGNQRRQIELAAENVEQAERSLELNMARIRAAEGLPIEALQAIQAAHDARESYLEVTLDYNRAQLRLLRAVGRPPATQEF